MSIWVLIIFVAGTGDSVATHEFNSEQACIYAAKRVSDEELRHAKGFCVPKGVAE